MNALDRAKNAVEDIRGKAKEVPGKATDDEDPEAEGKADQFKADLKNASQKVEDAFGN